MAERSQKRLNQEQDATVPAQVSSADTRRNSSRKQNKKGKRKWIYDLIIVLLIGVMGFSGYKIYTALHSYAEADKEYKEIKNEGVVFLDVDPFTYEDEGNTVKPTQGASEAGMPSEEIPPSGEDQPSGENQPARPDDPSRIEPSADEPLPEASTERKQVYTLPSEEPTWAQQTTSPKTELEVIREAPPLGALGIDFEGLKRQNPHFFGWLQGQQNNMNLPVVQGPDNSYYLKHTFYRTENGSGTLFVDYRNNPLEDDVTFIYGHHMKNNSMFGDLDRYDSYAYWAANPTFRLYTENGVYELRVFASIYTDGNEKIKFNFADEEEFTAAVNSYIYRSQFLTQVNVSYGDKLVCLSTCAYHVKDGRYLLVCKAVKIG
ncbi:MAG: class B sortase [Lachnospiraceae bacterium]|nr:class B sortase [Lachnospiraceae bacterium]